MKKSLYIRVCHKALKLLVILMPYFFCATLTAGSLSHKADYGSVNTPDTTASGIMSAASINKQNVINPVLYKNTFISSSQYTINNLLYKNSRPGFILKSVFADPVITCPGNIVMNTDSLCYAHVSGLAAAISDPDNDTTTLTWVMSGATNASSPISGINNINSTYIFPGGTTTITYRVTDATGNTAACSFTVDVNDIVPPTIICPPNTILTIPSCATLTAAVKFFPLSVTDNCGIDNFSSNPILPAQFPIGITDITWTTYDQSGNKNQCIQKVNVISDPPITGSITNQKDVACFGTATGSVTVAGNGGSPPYTYNINGGTFQAGSTFNNLTAGVYNILIRDSKLCTFSLQATILQSATLLTASITSSTNVICAGQATGIATVTASGGTSPYLYSWNTIPLQTNDTAINLKAGNYIATVTDASGCVTTSSITITQSPPLDVIISKKDIMCSGESTGTATATASGGTPPYTYAWLTAPIQNTATVTNLPAGTYTVAVFDSLGCFKPAFITITEPATKFTASVTSQVNILCAGDNTGSITVTGSGGTPPYQYNINGGTFQASGIFNTLTAGVYAIIARDANNCSVNLPATITEPANVLSATITSQTDVSCAGQATGSAKVTAGGGTSPYLYSWNTVPVQTAATAINLKAGNYTVTVRDNAGCVKTVNVTITQPTPLDVSITKTDILCKGEATGTATATASGGTPPYTFAWLTAPIQNTATATNLPAGTYTVAVFDSLGCFKPAFITITEPPTKIQASITNQVNVICASDNTGSVTVAANGGTAPYQYNINGGAFQPSGLFINLTAGVYSIVARDASNCETIIPVTITTPANSLSVSITSLTDVACAGQANGSATVTAIGGTLPYSYSWNTTPGQSTITAIDLAAGNYTVTTKDASGCAIPLTLTIKEPLPLAVTISGTNVSCFGGSTGTATVLASGGTPLYTYAWLTVPIQNTATISNLPAGTYTVAIFDSLGCFKPAFITIAEPATPFIALITNQVNAHCTGGSDGTVTISGSGGDGPYQYNIDGGVFQASGTFDNLSVGIYTLIAKDANNCEVNLTVTITPPLNALTASITDQTEVLCFGQATGSATVTANAGNPPYSYSWNTVPEQSSATSTNLQAGTYIVTTTDNIGCTIINTAIITEPATALTATITNQVNFDCTTGTTGSVTIDGIGGIPPYQYNLNGGTYQVGGTFANLAAGNYIINVEDSNNCTFTVDVEIMQLGLVTADAGFSQMLCNSDVAVLVGNNPAAGTGRWVLVSGSNTPTISPATGNVANVTGMIASPTPYFFNYSISLGSCMSTDTMMVTNYLPVTPSIAGGDQKLCSTGKDVTETMTANTPAAGIGNWTQLSGPSQAIIQDTANPVTDVTITASGDYVFQWMITNGACLASADEVTISVLEPLIVSAGADTTIFPGATTTLAGSASGGSGFYAWNWQPAVMLENSLAQDPITVALNTETLLTLTVLDISTLCSNVDTVMIFMGTELNPLVAVADYDTTLLNTPVTINVLANDTKPVGSSLMLSFCGNPAHGIVVLNSDSTITYTPYSGFNGDDSFCYRICDKLKPQFCADNMVYIRVKQPNINDLIAYNGISPNADGVNDIFKIKGIEKYPDNTLLIYNRWGDKIREFAGYNNTSRSWDGKNENGKPLPNGTYFYILDVKNVGVLKGWIYIRGE